MDPLDSPRLARESAAILQSMKHGRVKRDAECMERSLTIDQEQTQGQVDAKSSTCHLDNCLVCEKDTPFWLLTRNPTWSSIMRVVFYALMKMFPEKQYFSLRTDVYRFVVDHWQKICVSKKRSENWKKQLQDTLSHNKKLFASGYSQYKQNGYWGLRQVIDPWAVSDYIEDEDEEVNNDPEVAEFYALKNDVLGELSRMEERLGEMRDDVERASVNARQSDALLDEFRVQSEAELMAIGEEIRKMYEQSVHEVGAIVSSVQGLLQNTMEASNQIYTLSTPQICSPGFSSQQFASAPLPLSPTNLPQQVYPSTNSQPPYPATNSQLPYPSTNAPQPYLATNSPQPFPSTNTPQTSYITITPQSSQQLYTCTGTQHAFSPQQRSYPILQPQ